MPRYARGRAASAAQAAPAIVPAASTAATASSDDAPSGSARPTPVAAKAPK